MIHVHLVNVLSGLFGALEASSVGQTKAQSLGIASYGISMTTLEEVFLKIGVL